MSGVIAELLVRAATGQNKIAAAVSSLLCLCEENLDEHL